MNFNGLAALMIVKHYYSFRPQQGLTIMNYKNEIKSDVRFVNEQFPSPTGVNYHEFV